jgi:hypothetical protein
MLGRLAALIRVVISIGAGAVWVLTVSVWPFINYLAALAVALKVGRAVWDGSPSAWLSAVVWAVVYVSTVYFVKEYRPKIFSR